MLPDPVSRDHRPRDDWQRRARYGCAGDCAASAITSADAPDAVLPVMAVPKNARSKIVVASFLLMSAWYGVTARASVCPGDCSGDGAVAISELVTCVNAALGNATGCAACDVDADGVVVINELVAAVRAALGDCPPTPSPSPTATEPLPTTTARPSATPTDSPTASPAQTSSPTITDAGTSSPTATPPSTATGTSTRTPRPPTRTATASPTFRITAAMDVVRAAAEVSVQNVETVQVIALACASVGRCQTGAPASTMSAWDSAVHLAVGAVPRGVPEACAGGGTKLETCTNGVWTVVFTDCVDPGAAGSTNERNGTVVLTVADPGFCDDLVIDPLKSVALELQDYRHVERDAQGAEVARLEADWLETLTPTGRGCQLASNATQLADGFHEVSGTLHAECGAGSRILSCPRGSTNVTLRTNGLQMLRQSEGSPCELRLQMIGTVAVDDRDHGLDGRPCRMQFTQTFSNFLFAEAPLGDGTSTVRQGGRMTVDQFGPLDLVSRPRSSLPISASNRSPWQGAPTTEYRECSEEAQRSQGRRGPAKLVANFGDGTLTTNSQGGAGFLFVDGMDCPTGGDGELVVRRAAEAFGEAAPTARFQQNENGDPQVVFDFTGGDVETVTGCIGISPLTTCQ
jgi:hypothetical protein